MKQSDVVSKEWSTGVAKRQVARKASRASQLLTRFLTPHQGKKKKSYYPLMLVTKRGTKLELSIPIAALRLLNKILSEMGKGRIVSVTSSEAELTPRQAANILDVSKSFLLNEIKRGFLPHRKVRTHYRILFKDVMDYKKLKQRDRLKVVKELIKGADELGLGY